MASPLSAAPKRFVPSLGCCTPQGAALTDSAAEPDAATRPVTSAARANTVNNFLIRTPAPFLAKATLQRSFAKPRPFPHRRQRAVASPERDGLAAGRARAWCASADALVAGRGR